MPPTRCPHCQASLVEPVVFCGACGRRVLGWHSTDEGGSQGGDSSAASTRRIGSAAKPGDDPAATIQIANSGRTTVAGNDDPSASMERVLQPQGPRLIKVSALVLALSITAAGVTATVLKRLHAPPPRPPVEVNLDTPVFRYDAPTPDDSVNGIKVKRRRHGGALSASPATVGAKKIDATAPPPHDSPVENPAKPAPVDDHPGAEKSTAPVEEARKESANEGAKPAAKETAKPAAVDSPSPGPVEMAGSDDETTPPSPEEQREEAQARSVADGIGFVLRAHRAQVVACYERAFKDEQTSPGGRVTVDFTVDGNGKAQHIHTAMNSTNKEMLSKCLEQRIAEWDFPKPPNGAFPTSYPFVFSAGS